MFSYRSFFTAICLTSTSALFGTDSQKSDDGWNTVTVGKKEKKIEASKHEHSIKYSTVANDPEAIFKELATSDSNKIKEYFLFFNNFIQKNIYKIEKEYAGNIKNGFSQINYQLASKQLKLLSPDPFEGASFMIWMFYNHALDFTVYEEALKNKSWGKTGSGLWFIRDYISFNEDLKKAVILEFKKLTRNNNSLAKFSQADTPQSKVRDALYRLNILDQCFEQNSPSGLFPKDMEKLLENLHKETNSLSESGHGMMIDNLLRSRQEKYQPIQKGVWMECIQSSVDFLLTDSFGLKLIIESDGPQHYLLEKYDSKENPIYTLNSDGEKIRRKACLIQDFILEKNGYQVVHFDCKDDNQKKVHEKLNSILDKWVLTVSQAKNLKNSETKGILKQNTDLNIPLDQFIIPAGSLVKDSVILPTLWEKKPKKATGLNTGKISDSEKENLENTSYISKESSLNFYGLQSGQSGAKETFQNQSIKTFR